ncbi:MAG: nickel/cobalt transporter [Alphaproteobacteria bacterium]
MRFILCLLILLGSALASPVAASPFPSAPTDRGAASSLGVRATEAPPSAEAPGFVTRTLLRIRQMQASLHRDLAGRAGDVAATGSPAALMALMGVGFVYGIFHAAGPGHGKAVISAYLLANVARIRRGLLLAWAASAAQAATAIALVGVLAVLLSIGHFQTSRSVWYLEMASYLLLVLVGLWLLRAVVRGEGCGHDHHGHEHHGHGHHGHDQRGQGHHHHDHDHHHQHAHHRPARPADGVRGFVGMVAAIGVRPCSGAVILLLFSLAQGVFLAGVAGTLAMAVGTAITVSALALLSVAARRAALSVAGDGVWYGRIHTGLAVGGALAITLLGVLLFAAGLTGGQQSL